MTNGIEIEAALCPQCASTSIYSSGSVEIERACEPGAGGWRITGKVVRCGRCGKALDLVSKVIEIEVLESLRCKDCGESKGLRCDMKNIEKKSDEEWEFELILYCMGGLCRTKRVVRQLGNLLMFRKIKLGLEGIEYERDTGKQATNCPVRSPS